LTQEEAKKIVPTTTRFMFVFSQLKLWENSRRIVYQGKEGAMKIYTPLIFINYRN